MSMMTGQIEVNSLPEHIPTKAWVRFLRTYGPTPNNATMFDEHVSKAARSANISPIELTVPLVEEMVSHIKRPDTTSIIIAGTAGDGKTYHCRTLWRKLGGDPLEWAKTDSNIKQLKVEQEKSIYFVKDLSELSQRDSDSIFGILEESVVNNNNHKIVVIAANHGQILDRLRKRAVHNPLAYDLKHSLEEVFLQTGKEHPRLKVFDLSRTHHRKSLIDVLDVIVQHPEWDKCNKCRFALSNEGCPILENRNRLLGRTSESKQIRIRMANLIDLARLNGAHLPVRDLLALCSNIILGHTDVKDGLMRCDDVEKILTRKSFYKASLYDNIMGSNLPNYRVAERPVFQAVASFQIGKETTSQIDGLLIYGQYDPSLENNYNNFIAKDSLYGATNAFRAAQDAYLEGDELTKEKASAEFIKLLQSQRRRLFFTIPHDLFATDYFWYLTSYQNAGFYLGLLDSLESDNAIAESTRHLIVKGLNRIMTGMLVDEVEHVFIATSGGFTDSRVSVLCKEKISARTGKRNPYGLIINFSTNNKPQLVFRLMGDEYCVTFELSPIRFEFLARVALGALPNSFSSECLEDLLALKSRLLRRVEFLEEDSGQTSLELSFVMDNNLGHPKTIFVGLN